ncbi:hypothetical protein ACFZA1_06645 [Streptomyces filipinensis]|uniref:hypothetical protein n=1 Tax=Streptomyces filipinensis TaxID=66887 RepID=UPI0036ED0104
MRDPLASGSTVENVTSFVRYLDGGLPEVFDCAGACAEHYGVGARRVAELPERIEALTRMRDTLVRRTSWPAPS